MSTRPRRHRPSGGGLAARVAAYILLIPAVLLELLIHIVPMLAGVGISFLQLTLFYLRNWPTPWRLAGFSNYAVAVNFSSAIGSALLHSFVVTILYTAIVLGAAWVFGMAAAVFTQRAFRGRGAVRALLLIPYALPVFASVITWNFMLQQDTGIVNQLLLSLHLVHGRPFWLIGQDRFLVAGRRATLAYLAVRVPDPHGGPAEHPGRPVRGGVARCRDPGPGAARDPAADPAGQPGPAAGAFPVDVQRLLGAVHAVGSAPPTQADIISIHIYENWLASWNFGTGSAMSVLLLLFLLLVTGIYLALGRRGARHA